MSMKGIQKPSERDLGIVGHVLQDDETVLISLTYADLWVIMSGFQLLTRHPEMPNRMKQAYESCGKQVQAIITQKHPQSSEIAEKGWNPEYDQ